jgi:ubiquitin-like protein Pup
MALFNKQKQTRTQPTSEETPVDPKDLRDANQAQATADLLDEIDSVLEKNAQQFVDSFVQKGGQ